MIEYSKDYWDGYYEPTREIKLTVPSQFAAFVSSNIDPNALVIDVGCDNGRDAIFFGMHGFEVIGIDGSAAAIEYCGRASTAFGTGTTFICRNVEDLARDDCGLESRIRQRKGKVIIYSRFFLHAITEDQENQFLCWSKKLAMMASVEMYFEFRTMRDEMLPKTTAAHYRRFINPIIGLSKYIHAGFEVTYFAEGFGFAKLGKDDAHVARVAYRSNGEHRS